MACEPETELENAGQFSCIIPPGLHAAVQSYLLARIRGGSMDVNEIVRDTACEFSCIPQGLLPRIKTYLLCQLSNTGGGGTLPTASCTHPIIDDPVTGWAQRVVNNGGAPVSELTRMAMCVFCHRLDDAAIMDKMISVNCLVPDNLIAALTPLIVGGGNDPWTNMGPFVGADLTVDGLKADGIGKYLRTGVIPALNYASDTNAGTSLYTVSGTDGAWSEMGCSDAATNRIALLLFSGVAYWDCWNTALGTGRTQFALAAFKGFLSGNRTAANSSVLYRASSTIPFAAGSSIAGLARVRPTVRDITCFAFNNDGAIVFFSPRRNSFFAIHDGLTAIECNRFFVAVHQLRISLGGGYA